jgi:hypothetical protein
MFTTANTAAAQGIIGVSAIGAAAVGQIPGIAGSTQPAAGFVGELLIASVSLTFAGSGTVGPNSSARHIQDSAENEQRAKPHQEHSRLSIHRCHAQQNGDSSRRHPIRSVFATLWSRNVGRQEGLTETREFAPYVWVHPEDER